MKLTLITVATACILFLTACGNGSETSETKTDTATTSGNVTEQSATADTTTSGGGDLMKLMQDMMSKMKSMQMTGDFDIDFANMMVEHHQGALDMAQVELSQGKDETMKSKAQEIINKQTEEQQKLKDLVKNMKPSDMKMGAGELEKSMSEMMNKMQSMKMSGDVDKDFATMMIHHHEHGIMMAKMELKNGMSDKLKQMAQKGITDQQKDMKELKAMSGAAE